MKTLAIKTLQRSSNAPSTGQSCAGCPQQNRLLAALSDSEWDRLLPHLEPVDLPHGKVLHEPGERLAHAYFPTTAIVSLMNILEDGGSTEFAAVGNEGVVGYFLFMGVTSMPSRAVVQSAGSGYRLKSSRVIQQFETPSPAMHLLLCYTNALMIQLAHKELCHRYHSLEQQLCQWLLLRLDRSRSNELAVTQELIASMMGVRREGVTVAACRLKLAGLISYHRGVITVLDRAGLEQRTCGCYDVVRREYGRLGTSLRGLECGRFVLA